MASFNDGGLSGKKDTSNLSETCKRKAEVIPKQKDAVLRQRELTVCSSQTTIRVACHDVMRRDVQELMDIDRLRIGSPYLECAENPVMLSLPVNSLGITYSAEGLADVSLPSSGYFHCHCCSSNHAIWHWFKKSAEKISLIRIGTCWHVFDIAIIQLYYPYFSGCHSLFGAWRTISRAQCLQICYAL